MGHIHSDSEYDYTVSATIVHKDIQSKKNNVEQLAWFTLEEIGQLSPLPKLVYSHAKYALQQTEVAQ